MLARYTIENKDGAIEFDAEAIGFIKCLQIQKLSKHNKKWKGYSLIKMNFSLNGLNTLHIKQFNKI